MMKKENGFTMIELIVVIALIAIISAILVPSFSEITKKSKIKTDINSLITIQNAVDLYEIETNKLATSIQELVTNGYIPKDPTPQYTTSSYSINSTIILNTTLAVYVYKSDDTFISDYIKTLDNITIKDTNVYLKTKVK